MRNPSEHRRVLLVRLTVGLLLLAFVLPQCGCRTVSMPPEESGAILTLGTERSRGEQLAQVLVADWAKESHEYRDGRTLYINAKAAFDGWLDMLELYAGSLDKLQSDQFKAQLQSTVEESKRFQQYVSGLSPGQTHTPTSVDPVLVSSVAGALLDAAIKLHDAYVKQWNEDRARLQKDIDGLRWKSFDQITPAGSKHPDR